MPARSADESALREEGRPQPVGGDEDEPRNSDMRAAETTTQSRGPHAGYDADLNPIDDEFINTRGSER